MKRLLIVLLFLAVAGGGAYYYFRQFQVSEPVRYSNENVYLTRYASIVTPSGVYGFDPGTQLVLQPARRASPGMVCVTDGTHQLEVAPESLTRNPDVARQAANDDHAAQAQAAAGVAAAKAHVVKVENDAQLARARDMDRLNALQRGVMSSATPSPFPTPPPPLPPRGRPGLPVH